MRLMTIRKRFLSRGNLTEQKKKLLQAIKKKKISFLILSIIILVPIVVIPLKISEIRTGQLGFATPADEHDPTEDGDQVIDADFVPQLEQTQALTSEPNPITIENQKPGTNSWTLQGSKRSSDKINEIKGYADKVSVQKGEKIDFKVTVNPAQNFTMEIYRLGWYSGLGGRHMLTIGPKNGVKRASCPIQATTLLIECKWKTDHSLTIPNDWVSGQYLVKLKNNNGFANYITFTLRDDSSTSDILFQMSTNTWQAYNKWGGKSLYPPGQTHAVKVSYDRPYQLEGAGQLLGREINFIRWIEKEGYDVTYNTNVDTHLRANLLLNHKAFISQGHDEYWTWEMRDAVEGARDQGINIGFFGGNESYWQVRLDKSTSGVDNRVIVGYKEQYKKDPFFTSTDPAKKKRTTGLFRYKFIGRNEQLMMGNMYGINLAKKPQLIYTVTNVDNWIFQGTNLVEGQDLTRIVGKEYNNHKPSFGKPANKSFTVVSKSFNPDNGGYQQSVIYQAPSDAWVFSAGTMHWSWGLDDYGAHGVVSPQIQKITNNILDRFIGKPLATPTPTPTLSPSPTATPTP